MTDNAAFSALLACPRCDKALDAVGASGHECKACRVKFPDLDGIPVLVAEPGTVLGEWRSRLHMLLEKVSHDHGGIIAELKSESLPAETRQRLDYLATALQQHEAELKQLLRPLEMGGYRASYDTHLALRTRLPTDQGLNTYYPNVHRDWCWGDEENELSAHLVSEALRHAPDGARLVAGAGAGRLAYDLALRDPDMLTVALDFNPMLLLVAAAAYRGDTVTLTEFPLAPRTRDDVAVERSLTAPQPAPAALKLIMADALRPPFQAGTFAQVVTPWLIDVIGEPLSAFAARLNGLLTPGGRWVSFGSLAFGQAAQRDCITVEEIAPLLSAAGFEDIELEEAELPYMCSPASRHGRRELTLTISATKIKAAKKPPRHASLPDWIVKGDTPIPLNDSFRMQAASTRVYAFIMSLIDGKRSLKGLAAVMEQQKLMSAAEAEAAIRSFLIKMYEDSRRETRF